MTGIPTVAITGVPDPLPHGLHVLDVQWSTEHLASLGVVTVPRPSYLRLLARAVELPLPHPFR